MIGGTSGRSSRDANTKPSALSRPLHDVQHPDSSDEQRHEPQVVGALRFERRQVQQGGRKVRREHQHGAFGQDQPAECLDGLGGTRLHGGAQ